MKPGKRAALVGTLLLLVAGCGGDSADPGLAAITVQAFDAHLRFLSSDVLEGRGPGTRGSQQAAAYISNQFALAGLVPAVGDSSYLQPVPLIARTVDSRIVFRAPGGASFAPESGVDFVVWTQDTAQVSEIDAELVFVGYGIAAPEYDWDDYEDVDVSGRVLLVLSNDPGLANPDRFRGDTLTYYGLPAYKFAEAARKGAAGAVIIHRPRVATVGWEVIRTSLWRGVASLQGSLDISEVILQGWIDQEAAEQVVTMARLDFATLLETAGSENFRPVFTGVRTTVDVTSQTRRFIDHNIAGILPGSDPELSREYVVISAHYDHLGIGEPVQGDSIYNGAYDNASGTALLLCLADAFGRLTPRPARSILFLGFTGEEPGLLGSRYYVDNPLVPIASTVLDINIDGANLWGATEDVRVLGAEFTDIGRILAEAARMERLRVEGDPAPARGSLYRSDQLSFMRVGVPAIVVGHGFDFVGRMPGWGDRTYREYIESYYYRPSDEYREDSDLRGAVQQGRIALRIGLGVANRRERPSVPELSWLRSTGPGRP